MRYLGAYAPTRAHEETYRQARHATLNFETCGGERSSLDDASSAPLGQMTYFPAKFAEGVVVTNQREEDQMTNEDEATSMAHGGDKTSRSGSDIERTETFFPTGPLLARISTKSGDVRVHASEGNQLEVTLRASSSKFEHLLELAVIRFDASNNLLEIQSQPRDFAGSLRGMRSSPKSWFDFGSSDLDVFVTLPSGSSLEVKTVSGDTSLQGAISDVFVSSVSGDVSANDSCDNLEVKTASGDVSTGIVRDSLKCRSASGDVRCREAATKTDIGSASGDVDLSAARPGEIIVKAVSGDVKVRVARGLVVDVNGNTVSGDMGTNIELDATGDADSDEEVILIKVHTVSGDIRIDKAS